MTALVIDDERLARNELKRLLQAHPEIQVVGEAAGVDDALTLIASVEPDLIFLDVQMPGGNGFELINRLSSHTPRVIFTTAFERFALRAFEVNALDYLLKPIAPDRLAQALARLAQAEADDAPRGRPLALQDQVLLRDGQRCWFVRVEDIRLLEAAGNYTYVHFGRERPLISRSLSALEARLPLEAFFRISRRQLLNLRYIEKVEPWFGGGLKVKLSTGEECEISRRASRQFRQRLAL
jgi:two-component system, LytTR family, response regulator